ncbi:MAG: sporulation protein YqfD [Oscillospiraceae bacterium]|nr:sporulation protein YqfD [Oscillospiraceae bacterium]
MFIIKLFHFILGYVVFKAEGGFPERFINLCSGAAIPFWDIQSQNGALYGKTDIRGYKAMRHPARRSGMRLRVVRRVGVPFFNHRYRKRAGLLIGLAVFVLFFSIMSNMVWTITVVGSYDVPEETILRVFDELGVRPGMRASGVNALEIERAALEKLPGLSWLALNLDGSTATIEVREKLKTAAPEDFKSPHHIVAAKDGVITVLEAYEGKAVSQVGSAIAKGDMLISGVTENSDGSVVFRHAKGYAVAQVNEKLTAAAERIKSVKRLVRTDRRASLLIFGIKFPPREVTGKERADFYESDWWLYMSGRTLPVGFTSHRNLYYEEVSRQFSDSEIRLMALQSHLKAAAENYRYSSVLAQRSEGKMTETGYIISGDYTLLQNIGAELPFHVEETRN